MFGSVKCTALSLVSSTLFIVAGSDQRSHCFYNLIQFTFIILLCLMVIV